MDKIFLFFLFSVFAGQSYAQIIRAVRPVPTHVLRTTPKPTQSGIEDVRLEGGLSWRGRLAVKQNGTWGDVCKYGITDHVASVACRQMKKTRLQSRPIVYYSPLDYNHSYSVLVDRLVCQGNETRLSDCKYVDYKRQHYKYCRAYPVGVDCGAPDITENDVKVRLNSYSVGTVSSTIYTKDRGHVEILVGPMQKRGYICQTGFDINAAKVVCRMLGFPTSEAVPGYYSPYGMTSLRYTEHWISSISCSGNEKHILQCRHSNSWGRKRCPDSHVVAVDCNRTDSFTVYGLEDGISPQNGLVSVQYHNTFIKYLCSKGFNDHIAKAVCKNLGFVKTGVKPRILPGILFTSFYRYDGVWLENYTCPANAKSIADCTYPYFGSSKKTCPAIVGLDCTGSLDFSGYRLIGGYDERSGRLELERLGMWRSVCNQVFRYEEAKVVCAAMGFKFAIPTVVRDKFGVGDASKRWPDYFNCDPKHVGKNLFECTTNIYQTSCRDIDDIGITCYDHSVSSPKGRDLEVKLIGGYSNSSGHVEIFYNDKWNFICNDKFDNTAAKVICKMAGFPTDAAAVVRTTRYGSGDNDFLLDDVICDGTETSIMDCKHRQIGVSDCSSEEAVAVDCFAHQRDLPIRLNKGRVEVQHYSVWGSVCSEMVEKTEATVICRQLGLGTTNIKWKTSSRDAIKMDGPIWLDNLKCTGTESKVGDCVYNPLGEHNCAHDDDLFVTCG